MTVNNFRGDLTDVSAKKVTGVLSATVRCLEICVNSLDAYVKIRV